MVTQTTLALNEVTEIMQALQHKFGQIEALSKSDTCYATTHRQAAVKLLAQQAEVVIVVGSKNSSNSLQLQKIALSAGAKKSFLIDDVSEMPWNELTDVKTLGISSGASAPEELVSEIIETLKSHYENLNIHDIIVEEKIKS